MSKKLLVSCKILFFISLSFTFAQISQKTDGSSSSGISMPEMPSVSMPSLGSGFYTPGRSDFYKPNLSRSQSANKQSDTSATAKGATSATNRTTSTASGTAAASESSSLALNQLSAEDISSMSNLGIFSQISSLLGKGNSNLQKQLLSAQNTVTANTADSQTLKQILSELSELKSKMSDKENVSVSDKSDGKDGFTNTFKKEPKILRFIVNGYDILATCHKIYFSDTETDGSFLLTGDRKYLSENKVRSETFYFFFHANGTDNGLIKYAVTPAVSQDYENEYSYLYQLTQRNELVANRTGNLVTLRITDDNWNMDLLLSLDR